MAERIYTPSQTVGPFYSNGLLWQGSHEVAVAGAPDAVAVRGTVADGKGPFAYPGALIEFSANDQFVRAQADEEGRYGVRLRRPREAPMLADGRSQAPHLQVSVFGPGLLRPLVTRMYFPDEEAANATDPVLELVPANRRERLIAHPESDGAMRYDISLQGPNESVFFSL
jgi:protocatechuate 3,4-dioxygenase, alpha subunit